MIKMGPRNKILLVLTLTTFILVAVVLIIWQPIIQDQFPQGEKLLPTIIPTPTLSPTPTLTPTPTPIPVGLPIKIEIPKLNLVAEVTPVGITPKQNLDVPKDASQVGWFDQGIRPGQIGAALLTGHYDTPSGRPAIFYRLRALGPGDEIVILTSWGERFVFRIEELVSEPHKAFPKELLYGKLATRELRLITCDGVWNLKERSYSKRLVVLAKL